MKRLIATLCCACACAAVSAQQAAEPVRKQATPEEVRKLMEASMSAMAPAMAKTTEAMIEVMLQKGEDPATARRIARFKKNLYDALQKEGFGAEQALRIMESTALPVAAPVTK